MCDCGLISLFLFFSSFLSHPSQCKAQSHLKADPVRWECDSKLHTHYTKINPPPRCVRSVNLSLISPESRYDWAQRCRHRHAETETFNLVTGSVETNKVIPWAWKIHICCLRSFFVYTLLYLWNWWRSKGSWGSQMAPNDIIKYIKQGGGGSYLIVIV